jgi:hypothetical protein
MHVSIRTYRVGTGSIDGLMHRVDRDFAEAMAREPGFIAYQAVRTGERTVASITLFREPEQAEASKRTGRPVDRRGTPRLQDRIDGPFRWRGDGEPRDRRDAGAGASLSALSDRSAHTHATRAAMSRREPELQRLIDGGECALQARRARAIRSPVCGEGGIWPRGIDALGCDDPRS